MHSRRSWLGPSSSVKTLSQAYIAFGGDTSRNGAQPARHFSSSFSLDLAVAFTDYIHTYRTVTTPIKRQQIRFLLPCLCHCLYRLDQDFLPRVRL